MPKATAPRKPPLALGELFAARRDLIEYVGKMEGCGAYSEATLDVLRADVGRVERLIAAAMLASEAPPTGIPPVERVVGYFGTFFRAEPAAGEGGEPRLVEVAIPQADHWTIGS